MGWKKCPYWLRGGIIGLLIVIVLGIIGLLLIIFGMDCSGPPIMVRTCVPNIMGILGGLVLAIIGFLALFFLFLINILNINFSGFSIFIFYIISFLIILIFWFLVGTLVGLIVKKVKFKKK
jgi:hypothetical protein